MDFVTIERNDSSAVVVLARGKVNAIDRQVLAELSSAFTQIERDDTFTSIVLTGRGKFFSFGLDVPALYDLSPEEFTNFLTSLCGLCTHLFLLPKPIVAAVNGHAVAGGCMLLLPCDARIAADQPMSIGLTEVALGASLFASTAEMLRYLVSNQSAERMLLTGKTFDGLGARQIGLIDEVVEPSALLPSAISRAGELAQHYGPGYKSLRRLIRQPIADRWESREAKSIEDFVRIWYSPDTRAKTRQVHIRS